MKCAEIYRERQRDFRGLFVAVLAEGGTGDERLMILCAEYKGMPEGTIFYMDAPDNPPDGMTEDEFCKLLDSSPVIFTDLVITERSVGKALGATYVS